MIISKPSNNCINSPIPEEDEPNETSNLLQSGTSATDNQPRHTQVSKRIVFSWKRIKDSASEFLRSQSDIYLNVTNTVHNLAANDEIAYAGQHLLSKTNLSTDHEANRVRPVFQSPNSFMGIGEDNQSLSFKNMVTESGFIKGGGSRRLTPEKLSDSAQHNVPSDRADADAEILIPKFRPIDEIDEEKSNLLSNSRLGSEHKSQIRRSSSSNGPKRTHPVSLKSRFFMFCNIYRVFVACGVLLMPYAIALCGLGPAVLLVAGVSALTSVNHAYLDGVCRRLGVTSGVTLETLCGIIFGPKTRRFVLVVIAGSQLCAFIGSFILATELFHHSLCGSASSEIDCLSRSSVSVLLGLFNVAMVLIPDLKAFGYISSLSVFFQFFALLSIFYYSNRLFWGRQTLASDLLERVSYTDWTGCLPALGIVLYISQRITFYLPIKTNYGQMRDFHAFYSKSMLGVFGYAFAISVPCFLEFFTASREISFQNFRSSFHVVEFFKMGYCLVIFLSNPINLFPIYNSIYSLAPARACLERRNKVVRYLLKLCIRLVITCVGVCAGALVDSFVKFCSFVGAFFFTFLGLVLPGVLLWKLRSQTSEQHQPSLADKLKLGGTLAIGIGVYIVTTLHSLVGLITSSGVAI